MAADPRTTADPDDSPSTNPARTTVVAPRIVVRASTAQLTAPR